MDPISPVLTGLLGIMLLLVAISEFTHRYQEYAVRGGWVFLAICGFALLLLTLMLISGVVPMLRL